MRIRPHQRVWRIRIIFKAHGRGDEYLARSAKEAQRVKTFLRSRHPKARIMVKVMRGEK